MYRIQCSSNQMEGIWSIDMNQTQQRHHTKSASVFTTNVDSLNQRLPEPEVKLHDGMATLQIHSLDISMYWLFLFVMISYRDNVDTIWNQLLIDDIGLSYDQSPHSSQMMHRELFAEIGSAQLNKEEKSRQRHIEKNVVEIPGTQLQISEEMRLGKSRVVEIKVRVKDGTEA